MQTIKSAPISAGKPETKAKNRPTPAGSDESTAPHITHEQIASLACKLYMESGCKQGRDAENWLQAEQILRKQAQRQNNSWQSDSARSRSGGKSEEGRQERTRQQF
jgi:Protein of unknown function (DUF2934)